jgi:HD domain-containing protein
LDALQSILELLATPELKNFARIALSNNSLAFPFVNAPASLQHHHNQPGGLLEHSIECADIVAGMSWFPTHLRELGVVAALFHDVGKVATMTGEMKRTTTGYLLDHDLLTFQELSSPLEVLDNEWPDGGRALRYIMSWDKARFHQPVPLMPIAEAVRFADRCSTGIHMEERLYEGLPDWQQFVKTDAGARFWRPRCPQSLLDGDKAAVNSGRH